MPTRTRDGILSGMPEETVIYRFEVMTIMVMIGDIRDELIRVRALLEEEDGEEEDEDDGEA